MNPNDERLSASGEKRREAILTDVLRATDRRRHVRAARRIGAAGCVVALIAATIVFSVLRRDHHDTPSDVAVKPPSPRVVAPATTRKAVARVVAPHVQRREPKIVVEVIHAGDVKPIWQTISDDQLLTELADAGRPSGVVELNGKAILVPTR